MLQHADEVTGLVPWVQSLASRVQGHRSVVLIPLLPKHLTVRPPPPAGSGLGSSGHFRLLAHHVPFLPGLQGALFRVRGERGRGRTSRVKPSLQSPFCHFVWKKNWVTIDPFCIQDPQSPHRCSHLPGPGQRLLLFWRPFALSCSDPGSPAGFLFTFHSELGRVEWA